MATSNDDQRQNCQRMSRLGASKAISVVGLGASRSLATVVEPKVRVSDQILAWSRSAIERGDAHFRVGGTKLYFPKARVILLRSNAKHTPYQAKFIVPKSFNKLDLRDYLFHIYGLRAMNVTTQLLHGKYTRANAAAPRYRSPQIKKMTIDMAEPFVWPEEPKPEENGLWDDSFTKNRNMYREDVYRLGSDQFKPSKAFDGAVGPFRPVAQPFIPKFLGRQLRNRKQKHNEKLARMNQLIRLDKHAATP